MVLHNNKWDRRAKHQYLKKHGLSGNQVNSAKNSSQNPEDPELEQTPEEHEVEISEPESVNASENMIVAPLPDQEELDPKLQRLFREKALAAQKPIEKTHAIEVADPAEIQRARAGVERSKMNKAVRERFGSSVAAKLRRNPLELDSDSDFDEFMDELDEENEESPRTQQTQQTPHQQHQQTQHQQRQHEMFEQNPQYSIDAKVEINPEKQDFLDKLFR